MPRPRVHEAADVPVEIEQELAETFELVAVVSALRAVLLEGRPPSNAV